VRSAIKTQTNGEEGEERGPDEDTVHVAHLGRGLARDVAFGSEKTVSKTSRIHTRP